MPLLRRSQLESTCHSGALFAPLSLLTEFLCLNDPGVDLFLVALQGKVGFEMIIPIIQLKIEQAKGEDAKDNCCTTARQAEGNKQSQAEVWIVFRTVGGSALSWSTRIAATESSTLLRTT